MSLSNFLENMKVLLKKKLINKTWSLKSNDFFKNRKLFQRCDTIGYLCASYHAANKVH